MMSIRERPRRVSGRVLRGGVLMLVLMLLLTACSSDSDPDAVAAADGDEQSTAPDETETEAPGSDGALPEGQEHSFTVALSSIGLTSVGILAAVDGLRERGYTIDTPEVSDVELITEGTSQNRFQFGSGANNATQLAVSLGAPIKLIVDRAANPWTVFSRSDIEDCDELIQSRVAIHSEGSVSGAMIAAWVEDNCSDSSGYDPLIIAGSDNRLVALQADEIDATPLELADAIILEQEDVDDQYHLQVSMADELADLRTTSVYGNVDFMEANPDVTRDLVEEVILQHRRINTEDGYLLELLTRYLPEEAEDMEVATLITDTYVEREIFDSNGALTAESLQYTVDFFGPEGIGYVEEEVSVDEIADLSYLEAVLDELGRV